VRENRENELRLGISGVVYDGVCVCVRDEGFSILFFYFYFLCSGIFTGGIFPPKSSIC
jgi:hypothetical protein